MEVKDYQELVTEMKDNMISHATEISDFNEGSNIMTIFESVANVIEEAYVDTRVGFLNNIKQIAMSIFNFKAKNGNKATANVQFSVAEPKDYDVTIPVNTIVSDGSHNFVTTSISTIEAGEINSNLTSVIAEEIGIDYNIPENTITSIVSTVSRDVVAVTNPSMATGGVDNETETETLGRFKTYINGLQGSNYYGLKAGVLALDDVRSVGIVEHFPPKVSDSVYNATVYVDDGSGAMTDELKSKVSTIINGDGTSTNPGLRAAGINIDVQPANQVIVNIRGKCSVFRTEESIAQEALKKAFTEFINNLEIDDDVLISDLILKARNIAYVKDIYDVEIGTGSYSSQNIPINQNQIARIGTIEITVEQVN